MRGYKHLTLHDRNKIAKMRKEGATMREIAAALHVSAATVCREIKRGTYTYNNGDYVIVSEYIPERSHDRYRTNLAAKGGEWKIGKNRTYVETLEALIVDQGYSPSAALAEVENTPELRERCDMKICRQTLYNYIDKGLFLRLTNKDLPFRGSRRKTKTKHVRPVRVPKGESIEKRPEIINERAEFGHWEMDCVVSCRGGKRCLLVLTERLTRQEIIRLMPDHTAASVVKALDGIERKYGKLFPSVFKSITMDNGSEFSDADGIERTSYKRGTGEKRTKTYYCHPYCSSERGSNEKQNQMIRRHFPKGTNFDKVTKKAVESVEKWLNRYPRLLLGWDNSARRFEECLAAV